VLAGMHRIVGGIRVRVATLARAMAGIKFIN